MLADLLHDAEHGVLQLIQLPAHLLSGDIDVELMDGLNVAAPLPKDLLRLLGKIRVLAQDLLLLLLESFPLFLQQALILIVDFLREHQRRLLIVDPRLLKEPAVDHLLQICQHFVSGPAGGPRELLDLHILGVADDLAVLHIPVDEAGILVAVHDGVGRRGGDHRSGQKTERGAKSAAAEDEAGRVGQRHRQEDHHADRARQNVADPVALGDLLLEKVGRVILDPVTSTGPGCSLRRSLTRALRRGAIAPIDIRIVVKTIPLTAGAAVHAAADILSPRVIGRAVADVPLDGLRDVIHRLFDRVAQILIIIVFDGVVHGVHDVAARLVQIINIHLSSVPSSETASVLCLSSGALQGSAKTRSHYIVSYSKANDNAVTGASRRSYPPPADRRPSALCPSPFSL